MYKYMGFMVPDPDDSPVYYEFKVMAYGCKPAVTVVTRLLRPIKAYLHSFGIKFTLYIDDVRISAATAELCSSHMKFTLHVLQLAGWRIQWKKTTLVPTQRLLHLGFVTDSSAMRYYIKPQKWTGVQQSVTSLLNTAIANVGVDVKTVAAALGRVGSLFRSHGSIVRILSRSLQHQLGRHVDALGWVGKVRLSVSSMTELQLLLDLLPSFEGCPIPSTQAVPHVYALQQVLDRSQAIQSSSDSVPALFVSDASSSRSFIFLADGTFSYAADFAFSQAETSASSSYRELLALCKGNTSLRNIQE